MSENTSEENPIILDTDKMKVIDAVTSIATFTPGNHILKKDQKEQSPISPKDLAAILVVANWQKDEEPLADDNISHYKATSFEGQTWLAMVARDGSISFTGKLGKKEEAPKLLEIVYRPLDKSRESLDITELNKPTEGENATHSYIRQKPIASK